MFAVDRTANIKGNRPQTQEKFVCDLCDSSGADGESMPKQ